MANYALNVQDFGAVPDGTFDCTATIQTAINTAHAQSIRLIYFPAGYYKISAPLVLPPNSALELAGAGGYKGTHLTCFLGSGPNAARAAIEYLPQTAPYVPNDLGLTIRNFRIEGNDSMAHAIYMKDVHHPLIENCIIEGFYGAGLLLDAVKDGSFNNVAVQRCGRTSGNINLEADRIDNAKTLYSAITTLSTVANDSNNMLRFNDCQLEQNLVSPYIWVKDPGPIGLAFVNLHAEVRQPTDWEKYDLFAAEHGDFTFDGVHADRFRNGFIFKGYGLAQFVNCRWLNSVRHITSGVTGRFEMANCQVEDFSTVGLGGASRFVNCQFRDVTIDYPAQGPTLFTNCVMRDVQVMNAAAAPDDAGVRFTSCTMATFHANNTTRDIVVVQCQVNGNFTNLGTSKSITAWNQINGPTVVVDLVNGSYVPGFNATYRQSYDGAPPVAGTWERSSIVWNKAPAPGTFLGWVCVQAGSPGCWKGFAAIS